MKGVSMDAFEQGDVYIDFPFERVKCRYDKARDRLYTRFYGETEHEVQWNDELFKAAIQNGTQITREDYFRDYPEKTAASGKSINYFSWAATVLLVITALAMLYVSAGLFIKPIQDEAVIFAVLSAAPMLIQVEWYASTIVGIYAAYSVRKSALPGLAAAILFALAHVHLHLATLGNLSVATWLSVLAAVLALIGVLKR